MTFRSLIKLVLLLSAFGVLAATYGARVLLYLEGGHGSVDLSCEQQADQQIADDDGKADPREDQMTCWSTLTGTRPQILTDMPPAAVTDTPSEAVSDTPSEVLQ